MSDDLLGNSGDSPVVLHITHLIEELYCDYHPDNGVDLSPTDKKRLLIVKDMLITIAG
jgi:hypothetical protein